MMVLSRSWRRSVPIQRSAKLLATGVWTGVLRIFMPWVRNISSNASMNWLPRSRTRARVLANGCRRNRLRAAWVVHSPVGLAVTAIEEDLAGRHVDEEQQVVATEERCVDGGEVAGHRGLGSQEL